MGGIEDMLRGYLVLSSFFYHFFFLGKSTSLETIKPLCDDMVPNTLYYLLYLPTCHQHDKGLHEFIPFIYL